jgi:superfamily I DNA/RNA helicase
MLKDGMQGYLCYLDEHQTYLSQLPLEELNGPTLVKGGAGTGKTALAVARLRFLAQQPEMGRGPALYLCYNRMLRESVVQALKWQYGGRYPWERMDVQTVHEWCGRYLDEIQATTKPWQIDRKFEQACRSRDPRTVTLVKDEINNYLRPLGLTNLTSYISLERRGASAPLEAARRREVWEAYERFRMDRSVIEFDDLPALALEKIAADQAFLPYRALVIDEGQDFSPIMIRLARALVGGEDRRLFVLADIAQSVYPSGFFWSQRELGARGRQVRFLRSSYRNTAQVQSAARSLYKSDAEIGVEVRETNAAERNGPEPCLEVYFTEEHERNGLTTTIARCLETAEAAPEQIAVLAYSQAVLKAAAADMEAHGLPVRLVDRDHRS